MTVVAVDVKGRPVKDVRFSALETGAPSAPTTAEGRTQVAVPPGLTPGASVELQVKHVHKGQADWVFISPWDRRTIIHGPGGYVKIVLTRRGDREALESDDVVRAITSKILAEFEKAQTPQQPLTEEQRKRILADQGQSFGMSVEEIDKAIRAWKERAEDPFDIGVASAL
jgi:hypothetical protein